MKEKRRAAAASGERAKVVKHQDNLRVGTGEFAKREQHTAHVKGERAEIRKHQDNLHMSSGEFHKREVAAAVVGERASVKRHADNLHLEKGEFSGRQTAAAVAKGERAKVVKHEDNLRMEGSFQGVTSESMSAQKAITKVSYNKAANQYRKDAQSSIVVGQDMSSTDKAVAKKVEERNRAVTSTAATVTETRAESAAARSKQITSKGVTSTVVEGASQEVQLQAAKADKFASSLRETSAAAVAQHRESTREMAVIEQHQRKQSAQQTQQQQQYSRQQQQHQHQHQSYSQQHRSYDSNNSNNLMASDYMYGQSAGMASSNSHSAGAANYQRWSNSAHSEHRRESQMTSQIQHSHSSKQSVTSSAQQKASAAWTASASAHEQQQRAAAFQQQRQQAALQQSQQKQSYTTTSQSSQQQQVAKAIVVSQEARASSAGRRRTWAESTHFHGEGLVIGARDSFTIGQGLNTSASARRTSGMTSDYHEVTCPASGLAKSRSGFKYDRQSGSGHKMFLPSVSN